MSPVLAVDAIRVGASPRTKDEAIDLVGSVLVEQGLVTDAYVAAMHDREAVVSTYLGNGVAIPHGTSAAHDAIRATGLAVLQVPDGVRWDDEPATLVIGIAARDEEHIDVLSRLATVLEDEALCVRLSQTSDPLEIHRVLTIDPATEDGGFADGRSPATAFARTVVVTNPAGLHARPAAQIVARLRAFDASVGIATAARHADARSITSLLALGASRGDEVTVTADGPDGAGALAAVLEIVQAEADR